MSRNNMIHSINSYICSEEESFFQEKFILLLNESRCFYRDHFNPGHITGSALLVNADGSKVLMNHHKFLNKWLCFGGHADGDENILNVAHREIIEESGIEDIELVSKDIFDIDIHLIPANDRKCEPEHWHYDVRYLFRANKEDFKISDESLSLKWCGFEEGLGMDISNGMRRLLIKAQKQ